MADPHNHTHQQRRHTRQHTPHKTTWATLATTALIATVLAIAATPAASAPVNGDSKQSHTTSATACLGSALDDHGFEDLQGLGDDATDAINCLAYYGITVGNTPTTFDPDSNVTRGQMALFLYRAAKAAGIDLMGGDMDAMYGDIDELSEERQAAIKALARNGILTGRNSMSFYPLEEITRAEMAVALVNLVDMVSANVAKKDNGLFGFGDSGDLPDDYFVDARTSVPRHIDNAISAAYELGITTGYPNGADGSREFRPHASVPRRNMASFITRALAHTNLRPEGLTVQVFTRPLGAAEIVVSVRDAEFMPVTNQPIDAFSASTEQADRAFTTRGTCSTRASRVDGANKCEIDGADPVTRTDGNTGLAQRSKADIGEGLTVWIWTGDIGDKVDNDTNLLEVSVDKQPSMAATATQAAISSDLGLDGSAKARYNQTVTFTIQLQDADENDASPPEGGVEYALRVEHFNGGGTIGETDKPVSSSSHTVEIGSDGSGSFQVKAADLDPNNDSEVAVRYTLSRTVVYDTTADETQPPLLVPPYDSDGDGTEDPVTVDANNAATTRATDTHIGIVVFSDHDSQVTNVSVDTMEHQTAPSNGNVGTAATVTVLDQYGRPMASQGIVLVSDQTDDAATSSSPRFTSPNGQVRIGYSYSGGAGIEILTAIWDGDTADPSDDGDDDKAPGSGEGQEDDTNCNDHDTPGKDVCGKATVFWVGLVVDEDSTAETPSETDQDIDGPADVLSLDADSQQMVIDGDAEPDDDTSRSPMSISFDSNDFFQVDTSPVSAADFAEKLAEALDAFENSAVDQSARVEPTLTWSGYVHDDSSSAAWFRLTTNLATNAP